MRLIRVVIRTSRTDIFPLAGSAETAHFRTVAVGHVAERHAGWLVWSSRPSATRAGNQVAPHGDAVFAVTVEASTYAELDRKLAEQDANDAAHKKS
jgi:hypothetical protein